MLNADNRLSLAASAIWHSYEDESHDYDMDGSGECGSMIARAHQEGRVETLAEFGFTPETYNAALRQRLCGSDGSMSYHVFQLLGVLEVESMDAWLDDNTFVCTVGYPGHPGAEYSSLAYLRGDN